MGRQNLRILKDGDALDRVSIAKPCPASWDTMHGSDTSRHCTKCDRYVYNFSELTRAEALEVVRQSEGKLCARFYLRADGLVMTKDCGWAAKTGWRLRTAVAGLLAFAGIACMPTRTMGAVINPEWELSYAQNHLDQTCKELQMEKNPKKRQDLEDEREYYWFSVQRAARYFCKKPSDPPSSG